MYVFQYPSFTSLRYVQSLCDEDGCISNNPVFQWLMYGKIGEDLTVIPEYQDEIYYPNRHDRYISQVEVRAIKPSVSSVTLAAGATLTLTIKEISSAVSSDTAIATATVSNGTLTVTGVAAGTSTVTVYDSAKNLITTITVTVS